MFFEIGMLKNFVIFTGKHLCVLESLNKVADLKARKETPTQVFSYEYCKFFMNTFFTERLHWLLLLFQKNRKFPSKTSVAEA